MYVFNAGMGFAVSEKTNAIARRIANNPFGSVFRGFAPVLQSRIDEGGFVNDFVDQADVVDIWVTPD